MQPKVNAKVISENIMEVSCNKIRLQKVLNAPQQGAAAIASVNYCEDNNKASMGDIIRFRS